VRWIGGSTASAAYIEEDHNFGEPVGVKRGFRLACRKLIGVGGRDVESVFPLTFINCCDAISQLRYSGM